MYIEPTKLLLLVFVLVVLMLTSCDVGKGLPVSGQVPTRPLPSSLKGYELYSWQAGREWYFTLIGGTDRIKAVKEITSGESTIERDWVKVTVQGVYDLQLTLERLPADAYVVWMGPQAIKRRGSRPGVLALPPRRDVEDVKIHCQELGVQLELSRQVPRRRLFLLRVSLADGRSPDRRSLAGHAGRRPGS